MEKILIEIISWFGAIILMIAPFYQSMKILATHMIFGLSLLTIQAISTELYNLVILNSFGIVAWGLKLKKEIGIEKARIN